MSPQRSAKTLEPGHVHTMKHQKRECCISPKVNSASSSTVPPQILEWLTLSVGFTKQNRGEIVTKPILQQHNKDGLAIGGPSDIPKFIIGQSPIQVNGISHHRGVSYRTPFQLKTRQDTKDNNRTAHKFTVALHRSPSQCTHNMPQGRQTKAILEAEVQQGQYGKARPVSPSTTCARWTHQASDARGTTHAYR